LVAFGETSISACNDSHSSQATSTLGNTTNLNIGFLRKRKTYIGSSDWDYYIGSQTGTTTLVPIPKLSIASSDRELCVSSADWKSNVLFCYFSNSPFTSAFQLCFLFNHATLGLALVFVCISVKITFSLCLFAVNCSARHL